MGTNEVIKTVVDPGGEGDMPPVKISHKKDGRQRQSHRYLVSHPPPSLSHPAAGSATAKYKGILLQKCVLGDSE